MPKSICYYFSFQSPWAYVGHQTFYGLAIAHDLAVTYKPFALMELFSETGSTPLAKRHPLRQRYRMIELQRWREKRGLHFNLKPQYWPFDARLADSVAIAILQSGQDPERFMRRAFAGVWEDQLNLADADTVASLADGVGLAGAALVEASRSNEIAAIYEQNRQDAFAQGVFGSPAYIRQGEVFWGQDRIELLEDALNSGRAPYHAEI